MGGPNGLAPGTPGAGKAEAATKPPVVAAEFDAENEKPELLDLLAVRLDLRCCMVGRNGLAPGTPGAGKAEVATTPPVVAAEFDPENEKPELLDLLAVRRDLLGCMVGPT
jgi:hypothetical protein